MVRPMTHGEGKIRVQTAASFGITGDPSKEACVVSGYLTSLFLFIKIGLTYGLSYWMVIVKENLSKENLLYGSLRVQFILSRSLVPNHFWFKTKANIRRKKKKKILKCLFILQEQNLPQGIVESIILSPTGVWQGCYMSPGLREKTSKVLFFFLFSHFQTSHL